MMDVVTLSPKTHPSQLTGFVTQGRNMKLVKRKVHSEELAFSATHVYLNLFNPIMFGKVSYRTSFFWCVYMTCVIFLQTVSTHQTAGLTSSFSTRCDCRQEAASLRFWLMMKLQQFSERCPKSSSSSFSFVPHQLLSLFFLALLLHDLAPLQGGSCEWGHSLFSDCYLHPSQQESPAESLEETMSSAENKAGKGGKKTREKTEQ